MPGPVFFQECNSPLGPLLLSHDTESLTGLYFENHLRGPQPAAQRVQDHPLFRPVEDWLTAYFLGEWTPISFPIRPTGTEFRVQVWTLLQGIPPGETSTYSELASRLNHPQAARAVGAAVARNPLSIIIPCHRCVEKNGLQGFAGGLPRKQWLLDHESRMHLQGSSRI